MLKMKEL